jgi:hypothetical protein
MMDLAEEIETRQSQTAAAGLFAQSLGLSNVDTVIDLIGNQEFLRFKVGRRAPVYDHALRETLKSLPESNPFRGLLSLQIEPPEKFPHSMEAEVLRGLLARSTRAISGQSTLRMFPGQYVPFQNNEETQAIQPATHLIVGRRGVGKSTLILKAKDLLDQSGSVSVIIDMQPYAHRQEDEVQIDVLADLATAASAAFRKKYPSAAKSCEELDQFANDLLAGKIKRERASAALRRAVSSVTSSTGADLFVFLDDYHLVDNDQQPPAAKSCRGDSRCT